MSLHRRILDLAPFVLLASCSSSPEEAPASLEVAIDPPAVPRLLPAEHVKVGDERPIAWHQQDLLLEAFELESKALTLEGELAKETPDGKSRQERIVGDRLILTAQLKAARTEAEDVSRPKNVLQPVDRLLIEFAREHLVTEGYVLGDLETWWRGNKRFLESRDLKDRDAALAARKPTILGLAKAMPLRQLIADIEKGDMTDASRAQTLGALKLAYPNAPLPVAQVDTIVPSPASAGSSPAAVVGNKSLPMLDGASHPVRAIENLGVLLKKPS